ncbi:MAG TPA: TonB-dependent receptor [Polyangiaceae bacterium]|nr:TonB-dependent receptor [Polyangiaceae bacterium]
MNRIAPFVAAGLFALGVLGSPATARAQADVTVRGVRRSHDVDATGVTADEGSQVAGTEGDPVQVVHDLPGVARPTLGTAPLIVWGAGAQDTRTYVDGVEIPALFHGSALRSTVNGDLVRDVTLTPGGYGPDYGRGLGGVVRVETRDLDEPGLHGDVAADTLDGSALARAALGNRVHVAIAGRYGWIDPLLRAVDAHDIDQFFAIPRYDDYQAKVQIDLRQRETLEAVFLGSRDELTQNIADPDPSRARGETTRTTYERFYLRYRRAFDDGSSVEVLPWVGHDGSALDAAFGGVPATLDASTRRGGLRATHRSRPLPWLATTLGVEIDDAAADVQRSGSLEIPPREGDITVFGQPPGAGVNTDAWSAGTLDVAPHAQLDLGAGPLVVSPGLRVDGYLLTASRQTPRIGATPSVGLSHLDATVEPRISARLQAGPRLSVSAAAGVYSQPPDAADRSAVFGNPTLGPESADHATLGESLRVTDTLDVEAVGFAKWMTGLVVRNPALTPALAQALLQEGIGRAYGLQVLVRQRPWHGFYGWIAYTISRSERRDAPAAEWRLFDDDQPHVLTVVATKELGAWSFSGRFRFASGLPRTPVAGALFDARDAVYQPLFGEQNSIRLPTFWQLDARIDRGFALGGDASLHLYIEGLNLTNHAAAEEYVYNTNYTQRGVVTGLPLIAVVGVRGSM